jgi:endonuclease YncB( thermonuclease family)
MRHIAFAIALAFPLTAQAQIVTGQAIALDGDSLSLGGTQVRLFGIDAPEGSQTCKRSGSDWQCGQDAKALLASMVAGKAVMCEQRDTDRYGRIVARCTAGGVDLAATMIEGGLATALPAFSDAYVESEGRVKALGFGIWGSEFQSPAEYRAANPRQLQPPATQAQRQQRFVAAPTASPSGNYFRNCAAARAAGMAPLYRGQPGYRPEMDGDNDGIACEPYRGR